MMDRLFGFVKEGIAQFAVAWNPFSLNVAMLGRIPSSIPAWRYSGSKPSMQTTTVGCCGSRYVLS